MSDVTLRQLEYFAAVAETLSVTEAARLCHVSQAAVSLALVQLEEALGCTLAVRRRGKGVALTAEGQAVAARARQVAEQIEDLTAVVGRVHGTMHGRLTIGVFRTLASHVIPPLIDWFAARHPGVELEFMEGTGPEIQEHMLAGRSQLCVIYEAQLIPDCASEILRPTRRKAVLSPGHPLAGRTEVSLVDLAPHPAILMNEEPALQRTIAIFQRVGVQPWVRWTAHSVHAIQNVVGRGLAYSLLMQPVRNSPEGRPLLYLPITEVAETNSVLASLPAGVAHSRLVEEALAALRDIWRGEEITPPVPAPAVTP